MLTGMFCIALSLSINTSMSQVHNFQSDEVYVSDCQMLESDNYLVTVSDFVGFDWQFYAYDAYELNTVHDVVMYYDEVHDDIMLINID